jgi:hypothetical protein
MSDPNSTPAGTGRTRIDTDHQRGETGGRNQRTPAPKDPVAHDLPGAVPGNSGIDDVGARMIPRGNAAGETGPGGTSSEGASGGGGIPGGSAPRDDDRKPKRV